MDKTLILGDGLLGSELKLQNPDWDVLSRKYDGTDARVFNKWSHLLDPYHTIVNCIAYTTVQNANQVHALDINYKFVIELVDYCLKNNKKLIHISSDYVYGGNTESDPDENTIPIPMEGDWYSFSKILADLYIQAKMCDYLICRGTHKPKPFPYVRAWDQIGNFDYVDVIANLITNLIKKDAVGLFNVGTELKSMYILAKRTLESPIQISTPKNLPQDVGMNLGKLNHFLKL